MYKIEKTDYGIKLTFSGFVNAEELTRWAQEVGEVSKPMQKGYCVLLDLRGMAPLSPEACDVMSKVQRRAIKAGMARAALILDNPITSMQFKRLGRQLPIGQIERYIDSTSTPNCEKVATDWLRKGIDPGPTDPAQTHVMRAFEDTYSGSEK